MKTRLDIQPGAILIAAMVYFFGDFEILAALLGSSLLHEWGHAAVLRLCGAKVRCIRADMTGLRMDYRGLRLTRFREFLSAAAGPVAGALGAWVASFWGNWFRCDFLLLFAGTSLVLTLFNLIPAKPLDGWRMLHTLSEPIAEGVSFVTAVAVLVAGLWLLMNDYGPGLAVMGIILLLEGTEKTNSRAAPIWA